MFIAPFVPSPVLVIQHMLKLADLRAGEVFFDLGSGDGRTVIMAAKAFGARAVGVELREDLAKKALGTIHENGLGDRVTIVNGDMFGVNLGSADVVFLYLLTAARSRRTTSPSAIACRIKAATSRRSESGPDGGPRCERGSIRESRDRGWPPSPLPPGS